MVVMERSTWRGYFAGIAAILLFAVNFQPFRARAAQTSTSSAQQASTSKHKKHHPKPKPRKPVPLGELAPVPIETGEVNPTPLDTFFQGLADLESPPPDAPQPPVVHIIHFGDSHVASDYWAGILREKLQERFGDAGPGFVLPGRPWPSIRYMEAKSLDGQGWRTDGLRSTENDGVVGLGGMSLESDREASPASAFASFTQFQILAATSPGAACFQVQVDDADFQDITSNSEHIVPVTAPPPQPRWFPNPAVNPWVVARAIRLILPVLWLLSSAAGSAERPRLQHCRSSPGRRILPSIFWSFRVQRRWLPAPIRFPSAATVEARPACWGWSLRMA